MSAEDHMADLEQEIRDECFAETEAAVDQERRTVDGHGRRHYLAMRGLEARLQCLQSCPSCLGTASGSCLNPTRAQHA